MSTNYYFRMNICNHCDRYDEFHIGKYAQGWHFIFRGYPARDPLKGRSVISFQDWIALLSTEPGKIFDEYEVEVTLEDFLAVVENARKGKSDLRFRYGDNVGWMSPQPTMEWEDYEGNHFSGSEFC